MQKSGAQSWLFRYVRQGRLREMGLGPVITVSLSEAREKARLQRQLLLDNNPIEHRDATRRTVVANAAHAVRFKTEAEDYRHTVASSL